MLMLMAMHQDDEPPVTCERCADELRPDETRLCSWCQAEEDAANRDGDDLEDWPERPRGV